MEETKLVSARKSSEVDEEIYLNYEEGVCEAPPPAPENLAVKTSVAHLDFDKNVCTAEPLNYSVQPGEDDRFVFEPQPKAIAKKEEKKSLSKSAERFSEEPQPVRHAALKKASEEDAVFVGAMTYASPASSPDVAIAVTQDSVAAPSPSFKGAVIFLGIETASPSENATRARRERGEGQSVTESLKQPVLEEIDEPKAAKTDKTETGEGKEIRAVPMESPDVLRFERIFQELLERICSPSSSDMVAVRVDGAETERGVKERVVGEIPYSLLASETIYGSIFVPFSNSENHETRSTQPVFNDAQSLLVFLSQTAPDEATFQTPLVVLHPAMLPLETTRMPLFNLGRGGVSSESERVVARAETQGSKDNHGDQSGQQGKQDRDQNYAEEELLV